MKLISTTSMTALVMAFGTAASAATMTDLYGDKDCFGTGGACVEDGSTWIPGLWGGETADASDPIWTDRRYDGPDSVSYDHTVAAGPYASASVSILTAGIADIAGPYEVFADGVKIGEMPLDGFGHILAETFTFGIDTALVADGVVTISFDTISGDSWAIDYSELTVEAVPVPASLPLLLAGVAGLGLLRRRKKG